MHGVDIVIHAAALKQVPACEYNPMEAIKTNILGSSNVIEAALDAGVRKVMALEHRQSGQPGQPVWHDQAGCRKAVRAEQCLRGAGLATRFSCVRYGNVVGSRGSVIPIFIKQRQTGKLTITDARMTRFWLTLEQGVRFVIHCTEQMHGGEVFVPKIPSTRIVDLAKVIAPEAELDVIGIRPGEKLHEVLIHEDEARQHGRAG